MSAGALSAGDHRVTALLAGRLQDPFGFLGAHEVGGQIEVRAFAPQAQSVDLVDADGGLLTSMERLHPEGVYVARLASLPPDYRLCCHTATGEEQVADAYRFRSPLGELDLHLMGEGVHLRLYEKLGAHEIVLDGVQGVHFAVWAPNARRVSVVGGFNDWDGRRHMMRLHPGNGIWDIFVPGIGAGSLYKFELLDASGHLLPLKADPFMRYSEPPPGNASIVFASRYRWEDDEWMARRPAALALDAPLSIYEVHPGSWRRRMEQDNRRLSWRELADELLDYVTSMGYTSIELLPVSEHPFDGSWGYQPIGLFAPTWRFGTPDDFKYFVDRCHCAGISVIVDWVPAHFPRDAHGLGHFDGTALYEHADPRRGAHADWGTLIFNYGRREVSNYLLASALLWIDEFHIDALRVDAVASMLYLDYSRKSGEWLANEYGGNENLDAVAFLRRLNEVVHERGAVTIAEESTAWPMVSRPVSMGGLGFSYKWNMGWMNDTLKYMSEDSVHRKYHHDKMTFGLVYAFTENFLLPISHDEVVHGKGSMFQRMPGDEWQKFANLRAYYGFMYCHPGKKLLFMGCEFGQRQEWNHDQSLDWHLLEQPPHAGLQRAIRDLNALYRSTPALYEVDYDHAGFRWLTCDDREQSVLAFLRYARNGDFVVAVANFTPVPRPGYRVGAPCAGEYREILNTDATIYGGGGIGNADGLHAEAVPWQGLEHSLLVDVPPLATIVLRFAAHTE